MEELVTNFQMGNNFYIALGLFLLIVIIISTIIVLFLSRIARLEAILAHAKEIDCAKEERLSEFYEAFQEERTTAMQQEKELEYLAKSKEKLKMYESQIARLKGRIADESKDHVERLHKEKSAFEQLSIHYDLLKETLEKQKDKLTLLVKRNEDLVNLNNSLHLKVREAKIEISEQQKQNHEKMKMMKAHRGEIKEEFVQLAVKVFTNNSKEFSKLSGENISSLIKLMEMQIVDFKKQMNTLYIEKSKERGMLKKEIILLKELNQQISQDAINLTNALKGEKKQQGVWGEMILEKVLESSGLRKGVEYTREVSLRNDDDKSYRPDVLVHLPDSHELIIDAKTSLIAYEKYINAGEDEPKELYLKEHVQALRNHIRTLGEKNYDKLLGINTLDFIFMFVPIEGALVSALESEPALYDDAFKKQILLVGPTTLLIGLRAIENVWKYEKETQNAKEIASRAGALYDKFVNFSEDMLKLSKQFDLLKGSFESPKKRLSEGKWNIFPQVEEFK